MTILIVSASTTEGLNINDLKDATKFSLIDDQLKLEDNTSLLDKYKITMTIEKQVYKMTLDTEKFSSTFGGTNRIRLLLTKTK
jgi:predicted lactoylglutathione lyase